jgi:DNA-directed RNA polymerase subunit L
MVESKMQKINKKIIGILFSFLIILSGISSVSAINIKNETITSKDNEIDGEFKTVTIFRYGLDGSVETFEIEIKVDDQTDISELMEEKCEELLNKDTEFKDLAENNSKYNFISRIKSRGRGIHIKIAPQILWPLKFKLFPLLPPYIFRRVRVPIIYCRYPRDQKAYTTLTPLVGGNSTTINGYHSVFSIGFFGFKWWIGSISFLGFVVRTGF